MNAHEYLSQARYLDMQINSKIEQLSALNDLATKCTTTISDMPRNPNHGKSSMEDTIIKIIALKEDINLDIDTLVNLKREIRESLKKLDNVEYQTLLENRYLSFMSWEKIAVGMNYSIQQIYSIRSRALKTLNNILKHESNVIE